MVEHTQPWTTQTPTTRLNRVYCRRYSDEVAEFLSSVPADEAWQAMQDIPIGDSTAVWTRLPTDVVNHPHYRH